MPKFCLAFVVIAMSLPWKKTGVNRISRIVADIHPPKRGGSLVVETGFPTSLVDLFVKNRDRMRKSKKKKKKNRSNGDVVDPADGIGPQEKNSGRICRSGCGQIKNLSRVGEEEGPGRGDGGGVVKRSGGSRLMGKIENQSRRFVALHHDEDEDECVGGDSRTVIMAALKVFVVVVLALSPKRLALAITLSACVLLFLEFVSKRLVCFFKPCPKAEGTSNSGLTNFGEVEDRKQGDAFVLSKLSVVDGVRSNSSIEEIQIADSKREEISSTGPELKSLSRETKLGSFDTEDIKTKAVEDGDVLAEKHKLNSKRARIKAKFVKYLVPKKLLRGSNKGKKCRVYEEDASVEVSASIEDNKPGNCIQQEFELRKKLPSLGSGNRVLLSPTVEKVHEQKGVDSETSGFDGGKPGKEDLEVVDGKEGRGRGRKGILGYPILFLIGLAGLMGGRIVALLLTIAWCLMLKLIGTQALSMNFPPLRSSVAMSRKNFGGVLV